MGLAFGFGAQLLANTVGFLYPAYCSIKALESSVKNDDTQWLTYWVVFAFFSVVEYFADFIAGWVPFYWLSKCLFLVWCMAPIEANGANVIYSKVILSSWSIRATLTKHLPGLRARPGTSWTR